MPKGAQRRAGTLEGLSLAAVLPDRYRRFAGALRSFSRLGLGSYAEATTGPSAGRGRKWGSREESTAGAPGVGAARSGARLRGGWALTGSIWCCLGAVASGVVLIAMVLFWGD